MLSTLATVDPAPDPLLTTAPDACRRLGNVAYSKGQCRDLRGTEGL
jgi:hypothetical protein